MSGRGGLQTRPYGLAGGRPDELLYDSVVRHFELLSSRRALLAAEISLRFAPFDKAQDRLPPLKKGD